MVGGSFETSQQIAPVETKTKYEESRSLMNAEGARKDLLGSETEK